MYCWVSCGSEPGFELTAIVMLELIAVRVGLGGHAVAVRDRVVARVAAACEREPGRDDGDEPGPREVWTLHAEKVGAVQRFL